MHSSAVRKSNPALPVGICSWRWQEIKVDAATVVKDKLDTLLPGYEGHFNCAEKKGYAGTAFFVRASTAVKVVSFGAEKLGLDGPAAALDTEGRVGVLRLNVRGAPITLVNVYTPNSGQKLERLDLRSGKWDPAFRAHAQAAASAAECGGGGAIIVGDLNVAYNDFDVHNPTKVRNKVAGFCDAERDGFSDLLHGTGGGPKFVDVFRRDNPDVQQFTCELV